MNSNKNMIYSGTSGLMLPTLKALYPLEFQDKSRLTYYASLFNSVEINSSFYKIPMASTVIKWAESVPDNFQFTFKLSKAITHVKELKFNVDDVKPFIATIENIGNKKGCLLIQFPPSLKIEKINQLEKLLINIQDANAKHLWKVAIEFRNNSWYQKEVYDLLNQYKISLVIHDIPASATPIIDFDESFKYVRFHGPDKNYRGSYSDNFLYEYALHIKAWINEGKAVYIYFNNTMGDAVKNLMTLNDFIKL